MRFTVLAKEFFKKRPRTRFLIRRVLYTLNALKYLILAKCFSVEENLILFESFMGRQFACNPRAIYEELISDTRFSQYKFVWAFEDLDKGKGFATERTKIVQYNTKEYYLSFARAKYIICNSNLKYFLRKKKGQVFIQTWHGTPFKKLRYDINHENGNTQNSLAEIRWMNNRDMIRYDVILSPCKFTSKCFLSAFNLEELERDRTIVETGYPRNDSLFHFSKQDVQRVKKHLGIETENKKVILYAPTFRDRQHDVEKGYTFRPQIDFDLLKTHLGEEYIILYRPHYFIAQNIDLDAYHGFIYNVANEDNINDLYMIADLLITDYSSVFFDYANLHKPIIFYMHDLYEYENEIRGFYLSLEELPGKIVTNEEQLVKAVKANDVSIDQRYIAFNETFNYLNDGRAGKRAIERIFFREQMEVLPFQRLRRMKRKLTEYLRQHPLTRRTLVKYVQYKRLKHYQNDCVQNQIEENMVLFQSYMGRQYACSPKELYEVMASDPRFSDYKFVWAFRGGWGKRNEYRDMVANAEIVRYGTRAYYEYCSKAKYFVTNSRLPDIVKMKPGQIYIQSWHGTPLKHLGYDLHGEGINARHDNEELKKLYKKDAERFTYLLSPSQFTSEKLSRAFNLRENNPNTKIIEEGYPRNDFLLRFNKEDIKAAKREVGIRYKNANKKIILYAPTWRDNQHTEGIGYTYDLQLDFDKLKRELSDEYIILFRPHYFIASVFDFNKYEGFVYNVAGIDDINQLYILADVLITDYSSVFFDFANLKRRIIFFMYDFEEYTKHNRKFYLELDELPGEIVTDQEALIHCLKNDNFAFDNKYKAFNDKYNYLDDGNAAKRVIERIFFREGK